MFGLGMSEIMLVLVLALVVIGPKKLPEVAKALGKGYGEFKRAMTDFKDAVNVDFEDEKKSESKPDLSDIYENKWKDDIQESELDDSMDSYVETTEPETPSTASSKDTPTKTTKPDTQTNKETDV